MSDHRLSPAPFNRNSPESYHPFGAILFTFKTDFTPQPQPKSISCPRSVVLFKLKIQEEIFETPHHQVFIDNPWESDYLGKDMAGIGGQFQENMLGFEFA